MAARYKQSAKGPRTYRERVYASKPEARRAQELDLLLRAGEIVSWVPQVTIPLGLDCTTRVDFLVFGQVTLPGVRGTVRAAWFEEVKGHDNERFKKIRRLWKKYGPCEMRVLTRKGTGWTTEVLEAAQPADWPVLG